MTPKLYELAEDYLAFSELLEASDDPVSDDEVRLALAAIRGGFLQKTENIVALIREFEHHADSVDVELERLRMRKKASEHRADWLRGYLLEQLNVIGQEHVVTPRFTVNVMRTKAVEIEDEASIPAEFKKIVVTTKVDKSAIRRELERGGVPGAALVEHEHLRIT